MPVKADLQARPPLNFLFSRPGLTNLVLRNKMPSFPAGKKAGIERDRSLSRELRYRGIEAFWIPFREIGLQVEPALQFCKSY